MKSCCREHAPPARPSLLRRIWNGSFYLILLLLALLVLVAGLKTGWNSWSL